MDEFLKLNPAYIFQQVGDDWVLLPCGNDDVVDFSKMIVLNDTGATLISKMEKEAVSFEDLVKAIQQEFDADLEDIKMDVTSFLKEMKAINVIDTEEQKL